MANVPVDLEHRLHRYVVDHVIMSLIIWYIIVMILWMYPIVMVIILLTSRRLSQVM